MDDFLEASWACLPGWSPLGRAPPRWGFGKKLRTRMLTLIFVFKCDFLRFRSDLGPILGGFGRLKWTQKSIFGRFFRKRRFSENRCFSQGKLLFFRFRAHKFNENSTQNRIRKYICFKRWLFSVFWKFLADFGTILDGSKSLKIQNAAPGALQKLIKKRSRWPKNRFWGVSRTHLFSKVGLGRVLEDFGRIFGGFFRVADHLLTLILLL